MTTQRIQYREVPATCLDGTPWQWSGGCEPFTVGTRVKIILNGWKIGGKETERGDIPGTVVGYRIDAGWLMAVVDADFVPHWYMQLGRGRIAVFAGRELEPL